MSITRWDPWGDMVSLRDAMDNLLRESFVPSHGGPAAGGRTMNLPLDVEERGDDFVVTAPIPGISPDNVEISVHGDRLRIRAERREERREGGEGRRWLLREQRLGAFERTVTLPCAVNAGKAAAEFQDGILTITLPKADQVRERRIPVRSGQERARQDQPQDVPIEPGTPGGGNAAP